MDNSDSEKRDVRVDTLVVNEIYLSLQGESTFAGLPCIFVRLTACNLRCSYCDTAYAFTQGEKMTFQEIERRVEELSQGFSEGKGAMGYRLPLIEFTGGEPLLQAKCPDLMAAFCDRGFTVLVETSGAHDIGRVDRRVRRIMDLKCPSSGEVGRNLWSNIEELTHQDELKFVIGTEEDYQWALDRIGEWRLKDRCEILFSWVAPLTEGQRDPVLKKVPEGHHPITRLQLVERIIADRLPVRFQLQAHKVIWPPDQIGV